MCTYNEFVTDYNNPNLTAHDVRRVNGLNSNQYSKLRAKALKNKDIPPVRHMNNNNAKYYIETSNGDFQVQKTINGHKIIVGRFDNEKTAKEIVNACIDANWQIDKIKGLIKLKKVKPKNYSISRGRWIIQKSINGRNVAFHTFDCSKVDEDTVIQIVDFYREFGWTDETKMMVNSLFNIT